MQKYEHEVEMENQSADARNGSLNHEATEGGNSKKNIDRIYSNLNSRKTPT